MNYQVKFQPQEYVAGISEDGLDDHIERESIGVITVGHH